MFEIEDIQFTPVLKLDELLRKQNMEYQNRMQYIAWHFGCENSFAYPFVFFGRR